MSEQPKSAGERWRIEPRRYSSGIVFGYSVTRDGIQICECVTPEHAAEIILNAEKAAAFDLLAERGWLVDYEPGTPKMLAFGCWHVDEDGHRELMGSGPTPLAAVQDAEKRLKGGA